MSQTNKTQNDSHPPLAKFKPGSITFEFREYPFYWVMRLGNRYTHTMEAQLKKLGMNITSWRVGLILRENGTLSMTEIAEHAVGRLPTITKTVYRMQEQGYISLTQSETDARVTMVSISPEGLGIIDKGIENTSRIIDRAFDGLSQSQTDAMNEALKTIFENLS